MCYRVVGIQKCELLRCEHDIALARCVCCYSGRESDCVGAEEVVWQVCECKVIR